MATSKRGTKAPRASKATKPQKIPELRAGVEPSVRVFTEISLDRIKMAERSADAGNIRPAADICDWLMADDRISGLLNTRVQSLLGLEPTFDKSGDRRRSGRAVKALESGDDYSASYPEADITQMLAWGILLGLAPMRHRWIRTKDHGGRLLPSPEFWHPHHLTQDPATRQWRTRIAQIGSATNPSEEVPVNPGDGTWILHTPYGPHRPVMSGAWRGLARWALIKHLAMWDWSRLGEKGGILVAQTQPEMLAASAKFDSTLAQRRQLADDLYDRGREGVAVLPPGYNIKLVESLADSRSLYLAQIETADSAFAITIRGGNLTTNTSGGSLAAAEVQERTGEDAKRRFDAQSYTTTIHGQSLVYWALFNYGDSQLAPYPNYPVRSAEDWAKKGQGLGYMVNMAKTLATDLSMEIDRAAMAEEFDIGDWAKPADDLPDPGSKAARDAAEKAAKDAADAAAKAGGKPVTSQKPLPAGGKPASDKPIP